MGTVAVTVDTPVTVPLVPIVAMVGSKLLQVPPPASLRVMVAPVHTLPAPSIVPGNGLTVKIVVVRQVVGSV